MSETKRADNFDYIKPIYYDTLSSYEKINRENIHYLTCKNFNHISRYKGLRQILHEANSENRFTALETPNAFSTNLTFEYYDVPYQEENRLDLIAYKFYGSAQYAWIIAYFNNIEDGYTVYNGQRLKMIKNFTDLFQTGELLASIPAMSLNLGQE